MADKHSRGNSKLVAQHKRIQHQGDQELRGTASTRPEGKPRKPVRANEKASGPETETENLGSRTTGGSSVGP
jgi:hypothetical protein